METLPNEILIKIFEQLTLKDQTAVYNVSHYYRLLLAGIWQVKFKLFCYNFKMGSINVQDFRTVMTHIYETVEHFHLIHVPVDYFNVLSEFRFPKVLLIVYNEGDGEKNSLEDSAILTMQTMFPALSYLTIGGLKYTGKYFARWHHLKHLDVTHCQGLKFSYLPQMLKKMPKLISCNLGVFKIASIKPLGVGLANFSKLRKILLNTYELQWLLTKDFEKFTDLVELRLVGLIETDLIWKFYDQLGRYKRNEIESFALTQWYGRFLFSTEYKFCENLKKLTLNKCDNVIDNVYNYLKDMQQLRELHFILCPMRIEREVLQLLKRGSQLDLINFEMCHFFFPRVTIYISDMMKYRVKPLMLNFHKNYFDKNARYLDSSEEKGLFNLPKGFRKRHFDRMLKPAMLKRMDPVLCNMFRGLLLPNGDSSGEGTDVEDEKNEPGLNNIYDDDDDYYDTEPVVLEFEEEKNNEKYIYAEIALVGFSDLLVVRSKRTPKSAINSHPLYVVFNKAKTAKKKPN